MTDDDDDDDDDDRSRLIDRLAIMFLSTIMTTDCITADGKCFKDSLPECSADGWYYGDRAVTINSNECVKWTTGTDYYRYAASDKLHNKCRHIHNERPWCYIGPNSKWEDCMGSCELDAFCDQAQCKNQRIRVEWSVFSFVQ